MLSSVRIGMVGAGAVAARHVRTLLAMDGVELAAVADPALERAKELAAEAGAVAYPNHMELLAGGRLDAVYICVPPFAHGAPELAVIDAGLPMFVEKPVAIDQATAATIAARLAGRSSLVTCTGYHWRWLDIFDRAVEWLADRPARLVQISWLDKVPPPPWWPRRDRSGGQTIEQTTHVLDAARGLAGDVAEVHAFAARAASNPLTPQPDPRSGSRPDPRSAPQPDPRVGPQPDPRPDLRPTPAVGPRTGRVADGREGGPRLSTARGGGEPATAEAALRAAEAPLDAAGAKAALPAADAGAAPQPGADAEAALPAADIDDVSVASLRFVSGAVGTVASTCLLPRLHRAGVLVVSDGLFLELSETRLVVEADGRRWAWEAEGSARPRPDRDFVAAVRGGPDRIRVPWPEAYRTHLLACAITRSAAEGRPLPVPAGDEGAGGG
jgi:predicted dehydrogenase